MKYFVSYKQTGVSEEKLKMDLENIREKLSEKGIQTYILFLDEKNHGNDFSKEELFEIMTKNIQNCDKVYSFINHCEKSEGMIFEVGYAKGIGKEIIFDIENGFENTYNFITSL